MKKTMRLKSIIDTLERSNSTFNVIKNDLLDNKNIELKNYSIRTLQRDIKDIEKEFKIIIKNHRGSGKYYLHKVPKVVACPCCNGSGYI